MSHVLLITTRITIHEADALLTLVKDGKVVKDGWRMGAHCMCYVLSVCDEVEEEEKEEEEDFIGIQTATHSLVPTWLFHFSN